MTRHLIVGAFALLASTATMAQVPATQAAPGAGPQPGQRLVVDISGGLSQPMPIAIPAMPTPAAAHTAAGDTTALGAQVAQIVTNDLKGSGLFKPVDASHPVSYPQVTAPEYDYWATTGTSALVEGFVQANGDGTVTVGCYLYDVYQKQELTRQGFILKPSEWRRGAHKCADTVYTRLTGEGPYFDSRVVYVSETGPKNRRTKRLAIMDQDGANHHFLTNGQTIVLTPRYSPNQQEIVYMSYTGNRPRIYTYNIATGHQKLVVDAPNMTLSPRFSPDGHSIIYSMSVGGNTQIYRVSTSGGAAQRLTNAPGINTAPCYSPDGSRIVFESDRSGGQQIYVMNADGSNQHRISFGSGRHATPVWSPRGDLIAFTRTGGGFDVGVMSPDGSGEKILTHGWQDEGPSWSPNGRVIMFFRTGQGSGKAELWSVDLTGVNERHIPTPLDGSDPAWSPLLP